MNSKGSKIVAYLLRNVNSLWRVLSSSIGSSVSVPVFLHHDQADSMHGTQSAGQGWLLYASSEASPEFNGYAQSAGMQPPQSVHGPHGTPPPGGAGNANGFHPTPPQGGGALLGWFA